MPPPRGGTNKHVYLNESHASNGAIDQYMQEGVFLCIVRRDRDLTSTTCHGMKLNSRERKNQLSRMIPLA
jgi:hypothetical protein